MQMFTCIIASLTKEGCIKILTKQDKYHVGEDAKCRECAALLFKLLMQKAIIDTMQLPVSSMRTSLASILTCQWLKATSNSSTSTSRSTGKVSRLVVKTAMTS
jgi:hypothetical protein